MNQNLYKKVVLFLPPYQGKPLGPSLSLLSLASPLRQEGFQVSIIDGAIETNYLDRIRNEINDSCCFGLSLLTGPMIRPAIEASQFVRQLHPNLPIVYGGWHPTLLPEQTLQADYVDVVVRGQGEVTFIELLDCFHSRKSLKGVAGISYKEGNQIVHNPARPVIPLNDLPMPAYDLVNTDTYQKACGVRKTVYASSVGCPYSCNYCTDTVFYERRFNALSPERVVREVTGLVQRYALEEVSFLDSNFLVDVKRAIAIARGFIESGAQFRWSFQASTDLLCRMSDEEVRLLGLSGAYHMGFGTESGSEDVLRLMNKPQQRKRDMHETARKCHQANIKVTFNLILGYPGELESHRLETLRIMEEISRRYPNVNFSPNVFTAYPGIPIWNQMKELGLVEPQSLEEWAEVVLGGNRLPWFQGREFKRAKRMMSYFIINHQLRKDVHKLASQTKKRLAHAFMAPLAWRLRNKFYYFPFDLWLMRTRFQLVMRRSLLTGSSLGEDLEKIG